MGESVGPESVTIYTAHSALIEKIKAVRLVLNPMDKVDIPPTAKANKVWVIKDPGVAHPKVMQGSGGWA